MLREDWFNRFCSAVDSNGGHMAVLTFLILVFVGTWFAGMKADSIRFLDLMMGALLLAMKGRSGKDTTIPPNEPPKVQQP